MPKRSPWERHHKRQREINRKVFDLMLSASHPCLCGHVQGFHWENEDGEHVGKCADADCGCTAFDEDTFTAAQLAAGVLPSARVEREPGDNALAQAIRKDEQRRVEGTNNWDGAVHRHRPRPTGRPRQSTRQDPAVLDALRELNGNPGDLAE